MCPTSGVPYLPPRAAGTDNTDVSLAGPQEGKVNSIVMQTAVCSFSVTASRLV